VTKSVDGAATLTLQSSCCAVGGTGTVSGGEWGEFPGRAFHECVGKLDEARQTHRRMNKEDVRRGSGTRPWWAAGRGWGRGRTWSGGSPRGAGGRRPAGGPSAQQRLRMDGGRTSERSEGSERRGPGAIRCVQGTHRSWRRPAGRRTSRRPSSLRGSDRLDDFDRLAVGLCYNRCCGRCATARRSRPRAAPRGRVRCVS
jgi:hypothetical protein